jgi:hypothetical protein
VYVPPNSASLTNSENPGCSVPSEISAKRLHSHRVLQQRAIACTVRWWKATLWKHRLKMLAGMNLYGNGTRLTVVMVIVMVVMMMVIVIVMAMMIIMIMIIILDGRNTKFYELTLLYTYTH